MDKIVYVEIRGMGAFAYFRDPEGSTLGLWETA
jgi:predicted enzyme related to lactoylglutathione lyase